MVAHFSLSWFLTYFVFAITVLGPRRQLEVESLRKPAADITWSRCALRCNRRPTRRQHFKCMQRCASLRKRSVIGEGCDFYNDPNIWAEEGVTTRGNARVCLEFKLNKSGSTYESVNVSWTVPDVTHLKTYNKSIKYADVKGFFLHWTDEDVASSRCLKLPKSARHFVLNSAHLSPEKMNCGFPIFATVQILPIPPTVVVDMSEYNCSDNSNNSSEPQCSLSGYTTDLPPDQTVASSLSPSEMKTSPFSDPVKVRKYHGTPPKPRDSKFCDSTVSKLTLCIAVAAVFIVLLVLVTFLVKNKRMCSRTK